MHFSGKKNSAHGVSASQYCSTPFMKLNPLCWLLPKQQQALAVIPVLSIVYDNVCSISSPKEGRGLFWLGCLECGEMTSAGANAVHFTLAWTCRRLQHGRIAGVPLISVCLWPCAFLQPASPDWNQNVCAAASTEGEGDWGQHGEKALLLKEPFVAVSPALPLFSVSQRWHWSQPGTQENPHTCLTCRPSQSPL